MKVAKRVFLFILINLLVVGTISILLSILNVQPYLSKRGLDLSSLAVFCLIWGMGGALISLSLSRMMAKWMMGVRLIDPATMNPSLKNLLETVYQLCRKAGLKQMPEVGVYESPEINAFATGPSKRRSLIAVSSGLLQRLSQEELEGVLGHEIAHIVNGDMVTMTLLQGIVNAFVMFLARILASLFSGVGQNREKSSSGGSWIAYQLYVFLFEIVFMFLGMLLIAAFSRFREFRADKGGARIASQDKMVAALEALKRNLQIQDERAEKPAFAAFKISATQKKKSFFMLFATHPPLEERIVKLKQQDG